MSKGTAAWFEICAVSFINKQRCSFLLDGNNNDTSNHSTLDWRQEDHWFEASLGHVARSHLEKKEENNKEVGGETFSGLQ